MPTRIVPDTGTSAAAPALPPVVRRLGWVSFLTDAATEMLYPVLPLFLTATLGAPVAAIGLVEGLADGTANGLKAVAGWATDRTRRLKRLVVAGYATSALSKPLLALAPGWGVVLALRVTDRFGKAFRGVPRDLMLAEAVPASQRGAAFGLHRAMDSGGAVVGPLLGLAALAAVGDENLRLVFLLAFVPAALTLVLLARLPSPDRPAVAVHAAEEPPTLRLPWRTPYGRYVVALGLFGLGNSTDVLILLRAADLGLSATSVVLAYTLFNLSCTLVARPAGHRGDRLGRVSVFRSGVLCFAFVYLGFAVAPGAWAVWPLMVAYGAYKGLYDGASRAVVFDLVADPAICGRAAGTSQAVNGLAILVASVTAGVLYQTVSPAAPFVLGAACAGLSWVVLLRLRG